MQARSIALALIVVAAGLLAACDIETTVEPTLTSARPEAAESDSGKPLEQAEVVRVVDGDTIIVLLDGREERLRYIGIDAPESVTPDRPVECFGNDASAENARLVDGEVVYLERDVEERDQFGRLLRYVYVTGPDGDLVMVNLQLVAQGYAEAGFYPPNELHSGEMFEAERNAQNSALGLWGAC